MSARSEEGGPTPPSRPAADELAVEIRPTASDLDGAVETFLAHRRRLIQVAYRVVGDKYSAEDVVQEAWVRWQRTDRSSVANPAAFLSTTATHLAINAIQSARHRRETPADTGQISLVDPSPDVASLVEQSAAVEAGLELMMQRLTPPELCAHLLRKAFDLPYDEISGLLRTSGPNVRQLVHRAQLGLTRKQVRDVEPAALRRLVKAFLTATRTGDLSRLKDLLGGAESTEAAPAALVATAAPASERREPTSTELGQADALAA